MFDLHGGILFRVTGTKIEESPRPVKRKRSKEAEEEPTEMGEWFVP